MSKNEFKQIEKILPFISNFNIAELEDIFPEKSAVMKILFKRCNHHWLKFFANLSQDEKIRYINYFVLKSKLTPHLADSFFEMYQIDKE